MMLLYISAVVVENRDTWFADDNGLTKELCADPQENEDEQPEINEPCCACDEAKYEVQYVVHELHHLISTPYYGEIYSSALLVTILNYITF